MSSWDPDEGIQCHRDHVKLGPRWRGRSRGVLSPLCTVPSFIHQFGTTLDVVPSLRAGRVGGHQDNRQ